VTLTDDLHLMQSYKMNGTIHPLRGVKGTTSL
jgi:hypothetical protein